MVFYLLIAICLISYATLIVSLWRDETNFENIFFIGFLGIIFSIVFMAAVYSPFNELTKYVDTNTPRTLPIVSLTSDKSIGGSFTLGCGSIETVEYYFYYIKRADGNFVRQKLPVKGSSIREMEDGEEPRITWTVTTYENPTWVGPNFSQDTNSEYVFNVPHGTIVKRFSLQ